MFSSLIYVRKGRWEGPGGVQLSFSFTNSAQGGREWGAGVGGVGNLMHRVTQNETEKGGGG